MMVSETSAIVLKDIGQYPVTNTTAKRIIYGFLQPFHGVKTIRIGLNFLSLKNRYQ
jgi:hypothetical protein